MNNLLQVLKNPFSLISEKKLLLIALISMFAGVFLCYFLQIQMQILRINPIKAPTFLQALLTNCIIVFSLTIGFYGLGKFINKKTRLIDIFNAVTIALIPAYISLFQNLNGFLTIETNKIQSAIKQGTITSLSTPFVFIIVTLIGLFFFIYYIYLLFTGFKTATNAKKAWHYVLFFTLLILIDFLTSGLINSLY